MNYLFDTDVFHNTPFPDSFDDGVAPPTSDWYNSLFEDPLLSDRIRPGSLSPTPECPDIQNEHSYSMINEPCSPLMKDIKLEGMQDFEENQLDLPLLDNNETSQPIIIKTEDSNEDSLCSFTSNTSDYDEPETMTTTESAFPIDLRRATQDMNQFITTATSTMAHTATTIPRTTTTFLMRKQIPLKIKLEPITMDTMTMDQTTLEKLNSGYDRIQLPPTPPSSTTSDSEGGLSPHRQLSEPSSPQPITRQLPTMIKKPELQTTRIITQPIFTNTQRLPQSGPLTLSEEERRTLVQEGYPIPTKLPLTKAEEKSLKKVRRKIKNKISAQESRRKKKEYVEALERKMDSYTHENGELRKKVDNLEDTNQSLISQLHKLQNIVNKVSKPIKASATQTGTCMMVLVLCFAVFLGTWSPQSFLNNTSLPTMPSNSNTSPEKLIPIINHVYYEGPLQHDEEEMNDNHKDGVIYGPPTLDDANDPYATPNLRSSRMLMSTADDTDDEIPYSETAFHYMQRMNNLDMTVPDGNHGIQYDTSKPCLDMKIQPPQPKAASIVVEGPVMDMSAEGARMDELQAIMHPDIEAQLVAMDTINRLNTSKNK